MDKKTKQGIIATGVALIIITIIIVVAIINKLTPSKEVMNLTDYYVVEDGQVLVVMQDRVYETNGLYEDGGVYLDYTTVTQLFNKRIYWDANENILIYTTPTEVIKADVGSKDYFVNKNKKSLNHAIVKTKGDQVYLSLDFVQLYSKMNYELFKDPNRIVIEYVYGDFLYTKVKKPTQLRIEASIKSDIIVELKQNDELIYVDRSEVVEGGFSKVMTTDGIIGYVKDKHVVEPFYHTIKSDYKEPEYTSITKDGPINLVWHQVTNMAANNYLLDLLEPTKGVTTISPTWFKIESEDGSISSLADESYVMRAHNLGIEVWALVDDFTNSINMYELLSYTSRREKLINELIAQAIKYNLDGINIDFESISRDTGIHYVQFLRELSVKCRSNNIVLSVDNYVPTNYSAYYDITEQGVVADYVVIMAYDEHFGGSQVSGSVSSIGFVDNAIKNTLDMVEKEKIIIGIPFYTRLWKEVAEEGAIKVYSEAYSMSNGIAKLKNNGVEPVWDDKIGQYYGEYEKDGALYKMWLEEDESIEAKMKLIAGAGVKGVAAWKLGLEKDSVWNVIIKYVN